MTYPVDYSTMPPGEREYSPIGAWIAWTVIILGVLYIAISVTFPELRGKTPAKNNLEAVNTDLTLRLTLGQYVLFKDMGAMTPQTQATLTNQIRGVAHDPADQLRVAAVIGEIDGKDAAVKHIDSIAAPGTQPSTTPTTQPSEQAAAMRKIYTDGAASLSAAERSRIEELGFAGDVALGFADKPRETRPAVLTEARNKFVGVIVWFGVMAFLSLVGFVLAIIAIVMVSTGSLKLAGLPRHVPGIPFVEAFAIYLVLFFAGQLGLSLLHFKGLMPSIGLIVLLAPVFYYVHWRGESWQNVFDGFGWTTGRGVIREVFSGVLGYIAGLPLLIIGFICAVILMKWTGAKASHPVTQMVSDTPGWMLYLLASVWAPIFEETMFRGALLHHLRRVMPWIGAAPIVSLIFAMIHPQGLAFIPALGAIAIMLSALREWRGSIIAPMVAHGLSNAATITLLLIMLG